MAKDIIDIYNYLGVKRKNNVWSWGVSCDDYLILQVWQDESIKTESGRAFYVQRTRAENYDSSPGYKERLEHLEEHRQGKPCYLLICRVKDASQLGPREMADFNDKDLFVSNGVFIQDEHDDLLLCCEERIPITEVRARHAK